jgi:ABC-2 type transport system ATP-binding protein/lipopolysaccharide transport system ATP-binding protein
MPTAIETDRLGKRYRLGLDASGYDTLRDALRRTVRGAGRNVPEVWALNELDLQVDEGEALGVIGRNGAGKTTLLKILAGITEPTRGEARTRGRVGALLDVGTGLHPELTGRENVYLSGAIMGMRKSDVKRRFDEIADFAGVERFLDTPVKRYSSGMRLRLAFAVAAHIEPPIIVVDEVLAVGDAAFQEKCMGKVSEIGSHGRTVLFVSHDLGAVARICGRAIWLEEGRLRQDGPAAEVISAYLGSSGGKPLVANFPEATPTAAGLTQVAIQDAHGQALSSVRRDEPFFVELRFRVRERVPGLDVGVALINQKGIRVIDDARSDWSLEPELSGEPGLYEARVALPAGLLAPGRYAVEVWLGTEFETLLEQEVLTLTIAPRSDDRQVWIDHSGVVAPQLSWQVSREPAED